MKIPIRLDQALIKLYAAFYDDALNPECCKQCAVGNILDKTDTWKHLSDHHGSLQLNYVGLVHERLGRRFNGYLPSELLQIEKSFLEGCGYNTPLFYNGNVKKRSKLEDDLYNGMCAVITTLCYLDGIKNVLDYTQVLSTGKNTVNAYHSNRIV
ncbi:Na(+)-translocating NADH-quinone reductase subunit F [Cochleicola gelatinilyticus]|uniref:Na(+)-translocating NADH-quinone reductase subunit F n=1 Tax=Cochleicola gelatinilyticus TaxID=1763537 RepID=A0A167F5E1_9FLAO|nr:Na(+)-translocating NADH-quinone reductase subunit F [Cochleicola gelatinilyticus]OAB76214.1 Na(+)-translocating NADH-quinone reductase subunit F [Cochleicola gelatinilyticus]